MTEFFREFGEQLAKTLVLVTFALAFVFIVREFFRR